MAAVVNHRDVLACVVARELGLLPDEQIEEAVARWQDAPGRPLVEVIAEQGTLAPAAVGRLRAAVDRQASETCIDPVGQRLRLLPISIQRVLAPELAATLASPSEMPTRRGGETRPALGSGGAGPGPPTPAEGLTPGDRFDVLHVHAQGGLGVVFQARDLEFDRTVALKQIKAQWADDPDSRARFLLEARVTGRLEHPGIVPIYALGADASGRPYYAMRFIRGESLLEVIRRFHRGSLSRSAEQRDAELRKLLLRFLDVCHAVDYAHSKGVIHRDIKPSNIMLGKYGETLVVDWGLAKVIGSEEDVALTTRMVAGRDGDADLSGTILGAAIGTPAYMSPEQAAGRHDELTPATDVFSLGATLYHLLTGCLPHEEDDDPGVSTARAEYQSIIRPRVRVPWLPRPLDSICMKALSPDPVARYGSSRALAEDIDGWLADAPVEAHRESWSEQTFRWMRRHRTFVIAFFAVDLVATALVVVGVLGWNHLQAERRKLEKAGERQRIEMDKRDQQRATALSASLDSAERSAEAELAAGRFSAALGFLNSAVDAVADEPRLAERREALEERRAKVRGLVKFERAGEKAEEFAFFQNHAEARRALYDALLAVDAFDRPDWWNAPPADLLSPEKRGELQESIYRKLILLAANQSQASLRAGLSPQGADEARDVLTLNEMVQRFRPSEATRWHAAGARLRLGKGLPLSAASLAPPQNAADAYMLGALWIVASQNPALRAILSQDDRDPLEACKRRLRAVEALAPGDYWSHMLLAYVDLLEVGDPRQAPPAESRPHFEQARQALSQCLAINPDYWLAYAERSSACRQEIESRRAAKLEDAPAGWESTDELLRMMIHDSKYALELAGPHSDALWYSGFALSTAGQRDQAVDVLIAAVDESNRYDVETARRVVDPQMSRALPATLVVADDLLAAGDNPRTHLLKAMTLARLGRRDEALAEVEPLLAATNPPPRAWTVRGEARLARNDFDAAERDFRRAAEALPDHAPSLLGLAATHERRGEFGAALEGYDRAAKGAVTALERAATEMGRCRTLFGLKQPQPALNAALAARRACPACEMTTLIAAARSAGFDEAAGAIAASAKEPSVGSIVASRPAARGPNPQLPLLNGGFELGLVEDWNNDDVGGLAWHNVAGARTSGEATNEAAQEGRRSLHLVGQAAATAASYGVTSQSIPADPAARYRLTLWAKGGKLSDGAVTIVLDDAIESPIVALPAGTYGWRQVNAEFDLAESKAPLREGLKAATIRIVVRGAGEAWLDDLQIARVDPAPR